MTLVMIAHLFLVTLQQDFQEQAPALTVSQARMFLKDPWSQINETYHASLGLDGDTIRTHKGKKTTDLFLVGLSAFTRILRSTSLDRIQCFFHRLFTGWAWPHKLEIMLQNQKC